MKKLIYLPLLFLALSLGIKKVNAASNNWYISNFYTYNDAYSSYVALEEEDSPIFDNLISYYNTNWSSSYDYYYIIKTNTGNALGYAIYPSNSEYLTAFNSNNVHLYRPYPGDGQNYAICYYYNISSDAYNYSDSCANSWENILYSSNTTPKFKIDSNFSYPASSLQLPSWSDLTLDVAYPLIDINENDDIPTYLSLTNNQPSADFTQVNLSSYDYIILSLKNYSVSPFDTIIYTQGSLCFTPVYDYGMKQKQDFFAGYQVQGCTSAYSSLTPVSISIIQSDLSNHAVYYIKQQSNVSTILNIPTSIFDITYISSNNNDPQVVVGGRSYPVIPFNDLTDTANKSSEEGYVSGRVCSLGDVNCQAETMGMDINDLFTQPLRLLQSVWGAITSVFTLITSFIGFLPPLLQTFLYTSFMLGLIIGIIKIIL